MISFDFFDTLFTRKVARPISIFALVAEELKKMNHLSLNHEFIVNFQDIRVCVENIARENSNYEDITFEEIYHVLKDHYHLEEETIKVIQKVELEIEKNNLVPIKKYLNRMLEYLKAGKQVYVLSDMYLPSSFLSEVLAQQDEAFASVEVYVSNELRKTKATGNLYKEVFKLVPDKRLQSHVGDNLTSDFFIPRKLGFSGEWAQEAILDKNEQALVEDVNLISVDLIVGKWRELRVSGYDEKKYLGFKYITSIFFGFIYETLNTLEKRGVKKLYFLARDGQVLKIIADDIIKELNLKIVSEYVYVSRRSLQLPSVFELDDEFWKRIFSNTPGINFNLLLSRLQITIEEFKSVGGKPPFKAAQVISKRQLDELEKSFRCMKDLKKLILDKAAISRDYAYQYFEKIGFLDEEVVHILDVGWSATIQDGLYRLYSKKDPAFKIEGWYWGVKRNTKYSNHSNVKNSYIFYSEELAPMKHIEVYIELLAQADHGQTVLYGPSGPILAEVNDLVSKWQLPLMHQGVENGTLYMLSLLDHKYNFYDFKRLAIGVVGEFRSPSKYFAELMGSIPFSIEQDDSNIREVAPSITLFQFLRVYFSRDTLFFSSSRWMEGSIVRSFGALTASLLLNLLKMRSILMEIRKEVIILLKNEVKLRYKHIKLLFKS